MRLWAAFPAYAAHNADVFGRSTLEPGERVIDLQTDLEDLPATGGLCLRESTIKGMLQMLGYDIVTPEHEEQDAALRAEIDRLALVEREYEELREALRRAQVIA